MADLQIIGGCILSKADLEEMNKAEVKSRKYKYCTIECDDFEEFLAKAEYSEFANSWGPAHVDYNGKWITISEFYDTDEGRSFSVKNYRIEV